MCSITKHFISFQDFTELIVHHLVTLFLMVLSYTYNLLRVGSLVLCVHDQVDYFLAVSKH